jgi:hypothetical protein
VVDDTIKLVQAGVRITRLEAENKRLREALEQITALAENANSPSHSDQGRVNAWASLGAQAVRIAREALDA